MKVGDRVRLTEDGAEVAYRCDSPGCKALNTGVVRRFGVDGERRLVAVKRDGGFKIEVWAQSFWEVVK